MLVSLKTNSCWVLTSTTLIQNIQKQKPHTRLVIEMGPMGLHSLNHYDGHSRQMPAYRSDLSQLHANNLAVLLFLRIASKSSFGYGLRACPQSKYVSWSSSTFMFHHSILVLNKRTKTESKALGMDIRPSSFSSFCRSSLAQALARCITNELSLERNLRYKASLPSYLDLVDCGGSHRLLVTCED